MSNASDTGIIIGIGHAARQDDGVGPLIAEALRARGLSAVAHEGDGMGLLDIWAPYDAVIVIDALSAAAPGSVHVFADFDDPAFVRAPFVHSTHRFGVPEAIALGASIDRLPKRLVVVGIAGACFDFGETLSAPVDRTAQRLIGVLSTARDPFSQATMDRLVADDRPER